MGEEWPQAARGPQPFCLRGAGPASPGGSHAHRPNPASPGICAHCPAHTNSPTCRDRGLRLPTVSHPRPLGVSPGPQASSITSSLGWTAPLPGTWAGDVPA